MPENPHALAWLRVNWGTTWKPAACRKGAADGAEQAALAPGQAAFGCASGGGLNPCSAVVTMGERWPRSSFNVQPIY